jgi:LysM repeat protein
LDYLTVGQGDTLWSLAQDHATGDPRDWIAEVVLLNGLTTSELAPGQQIALP